MGKMIVSDTALTKIIQDLVLIQKNLQKNDVEIKKFLVEVKASGWQDEKYETLKKNTENYQKDLNPIKEVMKKFEGLKIQERGIVKKMGDTKIPNK